ncbi:hypothetical protein [Piscibacillus halophilus]|nr:hypothetical protein [Piscibacillus halophilus]
MTTEEKIKLAKREYQRKWRKQNKEKVKQYQKNYWLRKAEEIEKQLAQ